MKSLASKKPPKDQREKLLLLGLVDLYVRTGRPVGSNSLRENGFANLSSATIRNYFSKLEESGYLKQQHSSGGRIPTHLAYQLYAQHYLQTPEIDEKDQKWLHLQLFKETRDLGNYLQHAVETIAEITKCAVFLSSPRFDQDFIIEVKLVGLDQNRCLCILISDFGFISTITLYAEKKLSTFTVKRIESYFRWKITRGDKPTLSEEEEKLATRFYSEAMLRQLVGSSNFLAEDIYKTGFSQLLNYSDFNDASALAAGLGLFENRDTLLTLLNECVKAGSLSCWIGGNLQACSALAVPYYIHQSPVGAVAILGPNRIPYRKLFGILQIAADELNQALTKSLYKFKIAFRTPSPSLIDVKTNPNALCLLLENKND